ncbi:MAG: cation-translocating P-type ATPase [Gemmataceae bacterium]|nr:cation-translocating P-type ATPase [Gemmataceae bacterium]MDW8267019.1 cation-translocating P-type ATPase [Gemmataceae bacterium]
MSAGSAEACAYCGWPLPPRRWSGAAAPDQPSYCCFGCRFAHAVAQTRGEHAAAHWLLARLGWAIFLTMNVMVFSMALWTQDLYPEPADVPGSPSAILRGLFRHLCLVLALPVLVILGVPLAESAGQQVRQGRLGTDALLVVGVAAAYLFSAISVVRDQGPVYFEVGCMVLILVTLGRWLEATARLRASTALDALQRLLPATARRCRGGREEMVPLEEVTVGDTLRVLAGERIPCDGVLTLHPATVDEQVVTGESQRAFKEPGDPVFGGTLNLDSDLWLTATAPARGGTLARMGYLLREAQRHQGEYQRLADRVAAAFTPAVMVLALGAALGHGVSSGVDAGILAGLAVLLIACPCALGLATPLAVWAALGHAASRCILLRSGDALERLASVRALRLDKTGTLTTGDPRVSRLIVEAEEERPLVLERAAALAAASSHGYSRAIRRLTADVVTMPGPVRTLPGRGLAAGSVYLGSLRLMNEAGLFPGPNLAGQLARSPDTGPSLTCVGWDGRIRGVFVLDEELRPGVRSALAELRQLGLDVEVLTGDRAARGQALAQELTVPVRAELLPEDKVAAIAEARRRQGPVAFVGDGLNDAPALAAADVGIALGCGSELSRESAAVCLLSDELAQLPWLVRLARQTVRVIRQNLFWAFAYNVGGIALACSGRLNPVLAAIAMVLSSLLVITNSLRLGPPAESKGMGA